MNSTRTTGRQRSCQIFPVFKSRDVGQNSKAQMSQRCLRVVSTGKESEVIRELDLIILLQFAQNRMRRKVVTYSSHPPMLQADVFIYTHSFFIRFILFKCCIDTIVKTGQNKYCTQMEIVIFFRALYEVPL